MSEADVAAFERRLGHTLPEDYRCFLLEVNGGRLDRRHRDFPLGVVNGLFSLCETEHESRDLEIANSRNPDLPSKDLLYVGYDEGGAPILIALAGEHRGEVWFQNTSDPRPDNANPRVLWHDRRDMKKLADSFESFLMSLGPVSP